MPLSVSFSIQCPSISFFFFQRYGLRRPLHSFPTRRSSDLVGGALLAALIAEARAHGLAEVLALTRKPAFFLKAGFVPAEREQDRKSTRLNSSHQIISYAVFCLKKKNTK